ncbi:MAG: portal protein, partial [Steroidobacteraceae bacterium]
MLEHYIRSSDLRSVIRSDLIAGDVTGQWNLMLDWSKSSRSVTKLLRRNPTLSLEPETPGQGLEVANPQEEEEVEETEEVEEEGPEVIDFATEDLAVIPPTCNDLQTAKAVAVRVRMSKDAVQEKVDEGVFILPEGTDIEQLVKPDPARDKHNPVKKQVKDAGVRTEGTWKYALIYVTYAKLDLGGEYDQEAIIYFAGQEEIVGIIANPLWSGKRPLISEPVERIQGSFFGKSKIEPVKFLQWQLTDFWNMGQDSAMYSLLPIWAVDPLKTPQWSQLVMGLAAVWPVSPADVKPITAPQLWKDSAQICDLIKRQIWESLDVNELMMGRMPQGRKNNQLMGSMMQEQSINITDHATRYEECVLNPVLEFLFEFDQQYRTKSLLIEQRGEVGYKASLQEIPVPQWGEKYFFRWVGTEFMLGAQRLQQQIAWMNVLKGVPPQLLNGRTLDVTPILEAGTENLFGPEMAPRILVDQRNQFTV